jgi:hypothetical protein
MEAFKKILVEVNDTVSPLKNGGLPAVVNMALFDNFSHFVTLDSEKCDPFIYVENLPFYLYYILMMNSDRRKS